MKTRSKISNPKRSRSKRPRKKAADVGGASAASPVVIAGMHRSGTSLVAGILSNLGVSMGDQLLAADRNNRRGYFEDVDILALNREMLAAATSPDHGHRDWGWTETETLDLDAFSRFRGRATALIEARRNRKKNGLHWGWKDPRTTLALDFWYGLIPDARFVLVYRAPWEVADSMQRLGVEVFLRRPHYAWRIWTFYNRRILNFHRRHRDRTLLISSDAARRDPGKLSALLQERLGLGSVKPRQQAAQLVDADRFQRVDRDDPLVALSVAARRDCARLLAELDRAADLSGAEFWSESPPRARFAVRKRAKTPRLSVVIPCYEQGDYLIEAVASVERCVEDRCEVIVVNDGSQDPHTRSVFKLLRRLGYRVVDQENSGLPTARNRGIAAARAAYILPLDADNRLRAGFVSAALEVLDRRPKVGVVYGDRLDFGMRNGIIKVPPFDFNSLLACNYIDACAVMRKEVWSASGGYDTKIPVSGLEDWELWIRAAERKWQFYHLPGAAFDYRVRPNSMSAVITKEQHERINAYIVHKHRHLYLRYLPKILGAAQQATADLVCHAIDQQTEEGNKQTNDHMLVLLHRQFDEKAKHVTQLQRDLEEKTKQVLHFKGDAEEKARYIALLERENEKKTKQVLHFKSDAEEKTTHIALLQRESAEKTKQVLHFKGDAEEKAKHIALLQRENEEKGKQVLHFKGDAEEKATHIALLQRENEEKTKQVLHFKGDAEEKAKHVALLERENQEKTKQVIYFQADGEEKAEQAARFQREVWEKTKHVALLLRENEEKTKQVFHFRSDAEEKAAHISLLQRENQEKTKQVFHFRSDAEEKAAHISSLQRENEEKTKQVFHFRDDAEEKARHVTLLQRENKEKTRQVIHFKKEAEGKGEHIARLEGQAVLFKDEAKEQAKRIRHLREDLNTKNDQILALRQQRDEERDRIERLNLQLAAAEERLKRTKTQWAEAQWKVMTMRKKLFQQRQSIQAPSAHFVELQNRALIAEGERDHLRSMARTLQTHVEQERLRVQKTEDAYRKTEKELRSQRKQMSRLKDRLTGRLILPFGKRQRTFRQLVAVKGENA